MNFKSVHQRLQTNASLYWILFKFSIERNLEREKERERERERERDRDGGQKKEQVIGINCIFVFEKVRKWERGVGECVCV